MITLLAAVLLAAAPARAQTLDEVRIAAVPDPAALEAALRGSDRAAARDAANGAGAMMGSFGEAGQRRLVLALRDAAESAFAAPEVRAEAVLQLGECSPALRDDGTKRLAIGELLDVLEAQPSDARASYRRFALKGLTSAVRALPRDMDLERRAAQDLVSADSASDPAERTLALMSLRELIVSRPRVAQSSEDPSRRLESGFLDPIARDAAGFVSGARAGVEERWASYRVLLALAWASDDVRVREEVKGVMDAAAGGERDSMLRQSVSVWSGALRARG